MFAATAARGALLRRGAAAAARDVASRPGRARCVAPCRRRSFSALSPPEGGEPGLQQGVPGAQHGGDKLVIIFTCAKCETRAARKFSKQAYERGVVVIKCPGCKNHHLIADRLGFFEDDKGWDIEKMAHLRGEQVARVSDDDDNLLADLTPERLTELITGKKMTPPPADDPASS